MLEDAVGGLQGLSLLEIGPGRGFFAKKALERGIDYAAIENSEVLADSLIKANINVFCADVFRLDEDIFKGKKFDIIYMSHVLEHSDTKKDAESLIRKCCAWLKPEGSIMLNAPNVLSHKFNFWISDYTHNFVTTPLRVKNLLIDNGFNHFYERKMVLGVRNALLRKCVSLLFAICPNFILDKTGKLFMPMAKKGGFAIYGKENFTIIAKRMKNGQ